MVRCISLKGSSPHKWLLPLCAGDWYILKWHYTAVEEKQKNNKKVPYKLRVNPVLHSLYLMEVSVKAICTLNISHFISPDNASPCNICNTPLASRQNLTREKKKKKEMFKFKKNISKHVN